MKMLPLTLVSAVIALGMASLLKADQVVMTNGDLLYGTVVSLTTNSIGLNNENLGRVTLPRAKVAAINFGSVSGAAASVPIRPVQPARPSSTNSVSDLSAILRGIKQDTNLIQQVQAQMLGSGSPAAAAKFNEMLDGLSSGKMDIKSLRAEAQSTADEVRALKKDLGPDADSEVDGYLSVLDGFLEETATAPTPQNP
jgi:hypothetical protein